MAGPGDCEPERGGVRWERDAEVLQRHGLLPQGQDTEAQIGWKEGTIFKYKLSNQFIKDMLMCFLVFQASALTLFEQPNLSVCNVIEVS